MSNPGDPEKDVEKVKGAWQNYQQSDGWISGDLTAVLESLCWALAVLSVIGMLATMFFTGPNKPISGMTWLLASLGSITVFGALALVFRSLYPVRV